MEADTTFVRTDGVVELHTIAEVGVHLAVVVNPVHTESENTVRLNHAFDNLVFLELRMLVVDIGNRQEHLAYGLEVFLLTRMLGFQGAHDIINIHISKKIKD